MRSHKNFLGGWWGFDSYQDGSCIILPNSASPLVDTAAAVLHQDKSHLPLSVIELLSARFRSRLGMPTSGQICTSRLCDVTLSDSPRILLFPFLLAVMAFFVCSRN